MLKEIYNVLRRFISILGYIFVALFILGPVLGKVEYITNTQIMYITITAALGALSSLIFISKTELQGFDWWIREIMCILLNLIFSLPLTYYAQLWKTVAGVIIVSAIVILIAIGNHILEFALDIRTANQVNRYIKEQREYF